MASCWVRKRPHWWQYDIADQERPFADVLRHREGERNEMLWDAVRQAKRAGHKPADWIRVVVQERIDDDEPKRSG